MVQELSSNMEDYLEAVLLVASSDNGRARITDIRDMLGVKTPSVTGAVAALVKMGFLRHEPYRGVELTPQGRAVAEDVKRRHAILSRFLREVIGVSARTADIDACKMEHTVSRETISKLHAYLHKQTDK